MTPKKRRRRWRRWWIRQHRKVANGVVPHPHLSSLCVGRTISLLCSLGPFGGRRDTRFIRALLGEKHPANWTRTRPSTRRRRGAASSLPTTLVCQRTRGLLRRERRERWKGGLRLFWRRPWATISSEAAHQNWGPKDRCELREASRATEVATSMAVRRIARNIADITTGPDYHRTPEQPRSPCGDTTDTHTFARHNSATRANFWQSTSACRIENKTEQKGAARLPLVWPFNLPAAAEYNRAGLKDAMGVAVDSVGSRPTWRSWWSKRRDPVCGQVAPPHWNFAPPWSGQWVQQSHLSHYRRRLLI